MKSHFDTGDPHSCGIANGSYICFLFSPQLWKHSNPICRENLPEAIPSGMEAPLCRPFCVKPRASRPIQREMSTSPMPAINRIRRISPDGSIQTVAGNGLPGYKGDGGLASQSQLNSPYGLALDPSGNLYVADLGNAVVRRVGADGVIQTIAGGGSTAPSALSATTRAIDVKLNAPRNIAADSSGVVYISDFGLHEIFMVGPNGVIKVIAGDGTPGSVGDGGPSIAAELRFPAGLALDSSGALYIADSGNSRVRKIVKGVITSLCRSPACIQSSHWARVRWGRRSIGCGRKSRSDRTPRA